MKEVSQDFIDAEEAPKRKPAEGFHFWQSGIADWYFTNGDVKITYDGHDFLPAAMGRSEVEWDSTTEANRMTIRIERIKDPIQDYLLQIVVDEVWIEVLKFHRGMSPLEPLIVFIGKVGDVSFKGAVAEAECYGLQVHFKRVVPYYRYQPACNHTLYDPLTCKLTKSSYQDVATLSDLSSDGLTLTSPVFGGHDDGYYTWGYVEYQNYKRMVTYHAGNVVRLRYAIPTLQNGNVIDISAGCDRNLQTCFDKFNNVSQFLGFEYIPWTNPVTKQTLT